MATTRTYAVGNASYVRRLDNHTLPWVNITLPTTPAPWDVYDVMTDPNNPDKLTIVGVDFGPGTGILVSDDAGASWNIPGGAWSNGKVFYEVWYVDSNTIWVVGDAGNIVVSNDGGLTFNPTINKPGDGAFVDTKCIHALSPDVAVVGGSPLGDISQAFVWKTIDGGFSWTLLNGGTTLLNTLGIGSTIGQPEGIHISEDQQTITVGTGYTQNISIDGGATFNDFPPEMERSGVHLTWYPSYDPSPPIFRHVGGPVIQINETTDGGATWASTRAAAFEIITGAHFYGSDTGYYTIEDNVYSTSDGGVTGTLSLAGTEKFNAVWTNYIDTIYCLSDCEGNYPDIYTSSPSLSPYVGNIINATIDGFPSDVCWMVNLPILDTQYEEVDFQSVDANFTDCESCVSPPPNNRCWDLINCNGNCPDILANGGFDYQPFEGQLVYLNGNTDCIYEVVARRQAIFADLSVAMLSNPGGDFQLGLDNHTLQVTSLIHNSTEYVTGPLLSYNLTPTSYQVVECTGLSCNVVPFNTTENALDNTSIYLNNVFNLLNVPLDANPIDPASCDLDIGLPLNFFKIDYKVGDTFQITLDITNNLGTTTWVLNVNSGNVTLHTGYEGLDELELCNTDLYCDIENVATIFLTVDLWQGECPVLPPDPNVGTPCEIKPRLGEPGFSWKNCDPNKVVSVKNKFAESVYAMYKRERLGIETCCEYDLDKIEVKNILLDQGKLYDPDLCISGQPVPFGCCNQPCNAVATLIINLALTCPAPIDPIVDLQITGIPPALCIAPEAPTVHLAIG